MSPSEERGSPAGPHRVRRSLSTVAVAGLLASAMLVLAPQHAAAHAVLVHSEPADLSVLGTAPGAVVLDFSQALQPSLSQATVIAPSHQVVTGGPTSAREIRVDLLSGLPGEYTVAWTAVSAADGHATLGTLSFSVEASAAHAPAAGGSGGLSPLELGITAARWVEDAALLVAVGMLFIGWLGRRRPDLDWVRSHVLAPMVTALVAGVMVVAGEVAAAAPATPAGVIGYLTAGPTGIARVARVVLEITGVVIIARHGRVRWPAVVVALVALAASGHAAASGAAWWTVTVDSLHLLAAGIWAGGIIALATLRPPRGWQQDGGVILMRFTPWALAAFTTTVGLGIVEAEGALGGLTALLTTPYGRILLAKATGVLLMIPLSIAVWRFRRFSPRAEAVIGVGVIAAAALLAAYPVPARTATSSAAAHQSVPTFPSGLPGAQDLTMGGQAGEVLVGLSINPARPGSNRLTFYVLPAEGAAAAARLSVQASADGRPLALTRCGDTCRTARAVLSGADRVIAAVAGRHGGSAAFRLPVLPAPDGATLVRIARSSMAQLHSLTFHETLTGGAGTTITTDYVEAAPDSLQWTQPGGAALVAIGSSRYTRTHSSDPWAVEAGDPVTREPQFMWQYFSQSLAAHIVGEQVTDGAPTTAVSFFSGVAGTPIWFRFEVDAEGLVRHAEMLAPGHFMTQSYADFNIATVAGVLAP